MTGKTSPQEQAGWRQENGQGKVRPKFLTVPLPNVCVLQRDAQERIQAGLGA